MREMSNAFAVNLSILVTIAYLGNLLYKLLFVKASRTIKYTASVVLVIFAGWVSMNFGLSLGEHTLFDLRYVPLIIAALSYPQPLTLVVVGCGIGLGRLLFGINPASWAGCFNLVILGFVAAGLHILMKRRSWPYIAKAFVYIVVINVANTLDIAILGVIPFREYMLQLMPGNLSLSLLLSTGFVFMFRDFQVDRRRNRELKEANVLMQRQTEELHRAKIVLEERAKQLMLASQYKSEFLANMSHELRTPLNSIINLAQLISESGEEAAGLELSEQELEAAAYGEIILKSGQDLLQLINDILDLSKVEAGRLEVVSEPVSLEEVPEMLYVHFEHLAQQKGLRFEIVRTGDLPNFIYTDGQRVQQILRNLLSNAFKFTKQGEVILTISRQSSESAQKGDWVVFDVSDTGIGIPEDRRAVIFEAFQQADGTVSKQYGGTGLGLSISRDLARLLGGFIRLSSVPGQGSTFSLYLPLR